MTVVSRRFITTLQSRCHLRSPHLHFFPCGSVLLPGYFPCLCIFDFCNQRNAYVAHCVYPALICIEKAETSPTTFSAAPTSEDHVSFLYLHLSQRMKKMPPWTTLVYTPRNTVQTLQNSSGSAQSRAGDEQDPHPH